LQKPTISEKWGSSKEPTKRLRKISTIKTQIRQFRELKKEQRLTRVLPMPSSIRHAKT